MGYESVVLADDPTLLWMLADSTVAAADATGNGNAGTYTGTYTQGAPGPAGVSPRAVLLDGSSGYVYSDASFALSGAASIECWFKTGAAGNLIGGDNSAQGTAGFGGQAHAVYVDTSGNVGWWVFGSGFGSAAAVTAGTAYDDGKWHYLAATCDASGNMVLYLDGAQAATAAIGQTPFALTAFWIAGADNTNALTNVTGKYLPGSLCAFAAYPVALTSAQVKKHYNAAAAVLRGGGDDAPWHIRRRR